MKCDQLSWRRRFFFLIVAFAVVFFDGDEAEAINTHFLNRHRMGGHLSLIMCVRAMDHGVISNVVGVSWRHNRACT